jgi:hypothetical protein
MVTGMLSKIWFLQDNTPRFEFDIRPQFPPVEELLDKAERMTESCVLLEQVNVSGQFIKDVALRGVFSKKYSLDEAKRVSIVVDHMVKRKIRTLYASDAM